MDCRLRPWQDQELITSKETAAKELYEEAKAKLDEMTKILIKIAAGLYNGQHCGIFNFCGLQVYILKYIIIDLKKVSMIL